MSSQIPIEDLMSNMTICGYMAYKKVIKAKWGHKCKVLIQYDRRPYKERERKSVTNAQRKNHVRT